MRFVTDKISWTDAMKAFAEEQITTKLENLLDDVTDVNIKLDKLNKNDIKVIISADAYRAQTVGADFYTALPTAVNKLKTILIKSAKKFARLNVSPIEASEENTDVSLITKEKILFLSETIAEEAINQFEKTDYGFFAYKDVDSPDCLSILYRRPDGNYGVIRCK